MTLSLCVANTRRKPRIGEQINSLPYHECNIKNMVAISRSVTDFDTLPADIIFWIMNFLSPKNVLALSHVSTRLRILSLSQLSHSYDIHIALPNGSHHHSTTFTYPHNDNSDRSTTDRGIVQINDSGTFKEQSQETMSPFELYVRLILSELYFQEIETLETPISEFVTMTMSFCKLILQRMYLLDHINDNSNAIDYTESLDEQRHENMKTSFSPLSSQSRLLSPFMTSKENMHVIARVIADQICRGICLPETAALVLQALTSLHDQNRFQYMVNMPTRQPIMRMPVIDDRVTFGALCFQYLLQNILPLLHPIDSCSDISSISSMAKTLSAELMKGTHEGTSWTQLQSHIPRSQLSIPTIATATISSLSSPPSSMSSPLSKPLPTSQLKDLTGNILVSQQEKLLPIHIRSVAHLTRILCFLPLVGWHFQCLSSNTFVDMFLDRSKGDLSIDRVAVMVYGFMCVRDLETGRVDPNDLESLRSSGSCYWIIEQSIPTLNEVQAREIVRIVGRHRKLMQRLLFLQYDHLYHQHAYNSFDASEISSRIFQQDASSMSLVS